MKRIAAFAAAAVVALALAGTALAGTTYTLVPSVPSINWTDTTKWAPSVNYPGAQAGDTPIFRSGTSTLNVDAAIPNAVTVAFSCSGCALDFPAGGSLGVNGTGSSLGDGVTVTINGGTFVISGGTLALGPSSQTLALNTGSLDVQSGGGISNLVTGGTSGTLTVDGSVAFRSNSLVPALSGSGTLMMPNGNTLTVGAASTNTTFSGVYQDGIGGGAKLTKSGTGTLTLSGPNAYTGTTDIQSGEVDVTGTV